MGHNGGVSEYLRGALMSPSPYMSAGTPQLVNPLTSYPESPYRRMPEKLGYIVMALSMATTVAPTTNFGYTVTAFVRNLDELSSSGSALASGTTKLNLETPPPIAKSVQHLREDSGLTWEQLSRLFGVSRRAVHNWANGGRMTARHVEILTNLRLRISGLPTATPSETRDMLLAPGKDGQSMFTRWRAELSPDLPTISGSPLSASEALNVNPLAD
jgi:DNA-binding transcriptional regulator YiaG